MPIKTVEIRVRSRTQRVEVGGGLPGSPGAPGADGADGQDGVSVTGASINGSGHLILTLSSGGPIDVGYVVGPEGDQGIQGLPGNDGVDGTDGTDGVDGISITNAVVNGSGDLIITLSNGGTINAGDVIGPVGPDGDPGTDGVSITGATVDGSYNLILSLSTGGTINAGYVRGPAGAGTGDVVNTGSSTVGNFPAYTDTTGKAISDSGVSAASFATAAQGTKADSALQPTAIGVSVQGYDAELAALAALVGAADRMPYFTGPGAAALATLTAFARTLLDDTNAATARGTLGLGTAAVANTGTASGNVPVLDGSGLLDTAVLPAVAITDVFTVANQAAMLALTAQRGDIAIRTDLNKSFALSTNSPGTLADWKELLTPTDAVLSVAGLTGAISASALRTALSLVIGTNVQAWDADLDTWATKTAPTGTVVGTTDTQALSGKTLVDPIINDGYREELSSANTGTAYTIDLANGSVQILTLTGNCALTFPTPTAGRSFTMLLKQDATGSRTATWPSSVKWPGSVAPVITATASKADLLAFTADGTNWISRRAGSVYL